MLVRSGAVEIVVVDSVAALVPKHEIDAMGRCDSGPAGSSDVAGPQIAGRYI